MKIIIFVGVFNILVSQTYQTIDLRSDTYNILMNSIQNFTVDVINGTDVYSAFKLRANSTISLPMKYNQLKNVNISNHFIVKTIFKLKDFDLSRGYLFAIVHKFDIQLGLEITHTNKYKMSINLYCDLFPKKFVSIQLKKIENKWVHLIFEVKNNFVTIYNNCDLKKKTDTHAEQLKRLQFDNESILHLAWAGHLTNNNYEVSVQEIKLYPDAYNINIKDICSENITLPDSTVSRRITKSNNFLLDSKSDTDTTTEQNEINEEKHESKVCECSAETVSTLLQSMTELRGPSGPIGPTGAEGKPGLEGQVGKKGEPGTKGEKGQDGLKGSQGDIGPKGETGTDGKPGQEGPIGKPGPPGPPGINELKATDGEKEKPIPGEKGNIGPVGAKGPAGDKGVPGNKGETGQKGGKGEKGDQGLKGTDGTQGEKGERGIAGKGGLPGNDGKTGMKGEQGDPGEIGIQGPPGPRSSITDILKPEMNSIEGKAVIEKLRGFKGEIGDKGEKGYKGDDGVIGPPGKPGKDGQKGGQGFRGLQGARGLSGAPGEKGNRGETGLPGKLDESKILNIKGLKGERGDVGLKGEKGDSGIIDKKYLEKGEKGDVGPKGRSGTPGIIGPPGPVTLCNKTIEHMPGPPGPPGRPGAPGIHGVSIAGPKGEPGERFDPLNKMTGRMEDNETDEEWIPAQTIIFKSITALIKRTSLTPIGTLGFLMREEALLIRVEAGWKYVVMGSIFETDVHLLRPPTSQTSSHTLETSKITSQGSLRLIALNTPHSGKIYSFRNLTIPGITAANSNCRRQSKRLSTGYDSTFVPFLSTPIQDLKYIVYSGDRSLPIVNSYGEKLFDSWSSMFNGSGAVFSENMNIYSFNGRNIINDDLNWPNKVIWHGGTTYGERSSSMCNQWQDDSKSVYGTASSLHKRKLLDEYRYSCDNQFVVLCIEVRSQYHHTHIQHRFEKRKRHNHHSKIDYQRIPRQ